MNILKKCSMPVLSYHDSLFEQLSSTHNTGWRLRSSSFCSVLLFAHQDNILVLVRVPTSKELTCRRH